MILSRAVSTVAQRVLLTDIVRNIFHQRLYLIRWMILNRDVLCKKSMWHTSSLLHDPPSLLFYSPPLSYQSHKFCVAGNHTHHTAMPPATIYTLSFKSLCAIIRKIDLHISRTRLVTEGWVDK
ncbi:hypothetical protein Pcinc_015316 [Petrolisthes cinctipes]|uniref:Uncharacterized protein n=1 Tax=Petrolisthes cinctipes TaxID=88211 RepID=A0AAE1FTL7_PETCI|nr:hypothetical protein Pcinc_015316 [Petrolisthes cinctipes]